MADMHRMEEWMQVMSDKGWRVTNQRKSLLELFLSSERYWSPLEVYEEMKRDYPGVSYDTVYRNLRLLSEPDIGMLEQFHFQDGTKFRARCETHHHHHMICMHCEKTIPFEFCPLPYVEDQPGFEPVTHRFEIYGYCEACQQAEVKK